MAFLPRPILFESLHGRTANYEVAVTEVLSIWTGEETVLNVSQNLKFFPQLLAISVGDGIRRPFVQLTVPHRAVVICNRGDTAECVVGTKAVCNRRVETTSAFWPTAAGGTTSAYAANCWRRAQPDRRASRRRIRIQTNRKPTRSIAVRAAKSGA